MPNAGADRVALQRSPRQEEFDRYDRHELDGGGPIRVAGALIRAPGAVMREAGGPRAGLAALSLLGVAAGFCAAYGAILGLFQPGLQTLFAALKVPVIVVGSALLCTPTLHVFNGLMGSRLTLVQTTSLVLMLSAAVSVILVAFAPIAWFFGVSTASFGFMTLLHFVVFAIGAAFGLRTLNAARRYLAYLDGSDAVSPGLLLGWSLLLVVVGLQMAHYFRPLLLPGPFFLGERGIFLEAIPAMMR